MADFGRIQKELKEIDRDKASGVTIQITEGNLQKLTGFVEGPKDTAYEGGYFVVDITLDNQYPFVPPKMRFITKVWHPNVSSASGAICLDILKDQWSPALTLKTALLSLQALLSSPEPADPQDAVVAKQYMSKNKEFQRQAKDWTQTYAAKPSATDSRVMLVDLVHHVPQFLEHLPPVALAQLLASCVSLRKRVHEHVTKIRRAMDCHDVRVLTTGVWPHLTHLELKHSKALDVQSVSQLAKATHLQLQSLNLSYSEIDLCLAGVLLAVPYPNLKSLHLAGNNLTTSMTYLADAHLPLLEELKLHSSELDIQSMAALSDTRDRGTGKPCNMSGLSSDFAGLLANWQRGPALQCRRA